MKKLSILKTTLASLILLSSVAYADELESSQKELYPITSEWKHQIMIYGWLPFPSGTATFNIPSNPSEPGEPSEPGNGDTTEQESNIADNIDMIFMGTYKLEKDKYSIQFDGIYLGMSGDWENREDGLLDINLKPSLDAWLAAAYGGYNLYKSHNLRFDVVAGVRYASLKLGVDASVKGTLKGKDIDYSSSPSIKFDLIDGVVGLDGAAYFAQNWFVPYHFDVGTGSSNFSMRASSGIGYAFGWGDVLLSYRFLHYDVDDSLILEDIQFAGPLLGVNFRF